MDYQGYKLLDKIILVCRDKAQHESTFYSRTDYQAYLVDPSNKKQLESARHWAKWVEYGPSHRDEETGKWEHEYIIPHEPVEFEFDNKDFTLELRDCAGGSSQGGKLSFWNCLVTRDDKTFIIGINSDMLLELLQNATFINGKCQSPLLFITKTGKVGMTVEGSETWKQCIKDKELKNTMKKTQTSKFSFGDKVSTATINEVYLGAITKYYEFNPGRNADYYYSCSRPSGIDLSECTLIKLKKPVTYYLFEDLHKEETLTDILNNQETSIYSYFSLKKTCPKRSVTGQITMDCSEEEFKQRLTNMVYSYEDFGKRLDNNSYYKGCTDEKKLYYFLGKSTFGYGFESFELPEELLTMIKSAGVKYVEEV